MWVCSLAFLVDSYNLPVPWNARDVDLIIPAEPGDRLRLREDLGFVRAGVETERTLNRYPPYRTAQDYLTLGQRHYLSGRPNSLYHLYADSLLSQRMRTTPCLSFRIKRLLSFCS
jgi:hypothetical protein